MRNADVLPRAGESSKRKRSASAVPSARPSVLGAPKIFRACACGGGCPRCRDERVYPKLDANVAVSQPHDALEREADRVAESVTGAQANAASPFAPRAGIGALADSGDDLAPAGGHPLESSARDHMQQRFGADFGAVRVHTGQAASRAAERYDALAYTAGRNIVFSEGQYAPQSDSGRRLLAHELAHVMQQTGARLPGGSTGSIQRQPKNDKNEAARNDAIKRHTEQQTRIAGFMDKARKLTPKKGLRDSDNLFRNTVGLLDAGKLSLTILSPTHRSPDWHFDNRVRFDAQHPRAIGGDYPLDPNAPSGGSLVFNDNPNTTGMLMPVPVVPSLPQIQSLPPKVEHAPGESPAPKPEKAAPAKTAPAKTAPAKTAPAKTAPAPAKTPPQAPGPFIPGDMRLFMRGLDIDEGMFRNTFVHEGQHVADLSPRLATSQSPDDLLEVYKSEFRAFWIQPPPPSTGGLGPEDMNRLPEPGAKADNSSELAAPQGCTMCPPPADKGGFAQRKTAFKNARQQHIFNHIFSYYAPQQYGCCYVYNKKFHDEVNRFAYPESVNLINSDRLMNLNLEVQKLSPTMKLAEINGTQLPALLTQLDPLDWLFLQDPNLAKPFWDALQKNAPGFVGKALQALEKKGTTASVTAADVSKVLPSGRP